jgi:hypothetical protein
LTRIELFSWLVAMAYQMEPPGTTPRDITLWALRHVGL